MTHSAMKVTRAEYEYHRSKGMKQEFLDQLQVIPDAEMEAEKETQAKFERKYNLDEKVAIFATTLGIDVVVEEIDYDDGSFSLSRKFEVGEYIDEAAFDEERGVWVDTTSEPGREVICDGAKHIISSVAFSGDFTPRRARFFYEDDYGNAENVSDDDVKGVLRLWKDRR